MAQEDLPGIRQSGCDKPKVGRYWITERKPTGNPASHSPLDSIATRLDSKRTPPTVLRKVIAVSRGVQLLASPLHQ